MRLPGMLLGGAGVESRLFGRLLYRPYNAPVTEHYCYILECSDKTFYTGWTTDPARRLREHNAGRGSRYTRGRRPLRLAFLERQPDRSSAMRRELALKALSREHKQALVSATPIAVGRNHHEEEQHARKQQDHLDR